MGCSMPDFPVLQSPRACSDLCPLSRWCHPTISSSATLFSSCLQSFLASGCFPMSWLFTSGGQSIGASASASVLSMNIQGWFPLGLSGLISLQSKGLSRIFSSTTIWKYQFFSAQIDINTNTYKDINWNSHIDINTCIEHKIILCTMLCNLICT